jgi:3-oxoacyl-[acyl-carrier protein] reductase
MDLGIKNKIAVVTAASKGLGRACAEELAREGCRVAICSRTLADVERAAQEMSQVAKIEVVPFQTDVSRPEQVRALIEGVRKKLGDPEILVVNAGGPPPTTFATVQIEQFQQAFDLTLMSAVNLISGCVPAMKARGWGRIVLITSVAVKMPFPNLLLSNVVRSGVTAFMKTLATELAPSGITLNAVLPGIIQTDRVTQVAQARVDKEGIRLDQAVSDMVKPVPMKRLGQPRELAALVAFLASERASFITGTNTQIDGGIYPGLL